RPLSRTVQEPSAFRITSMRSAWPASVSSIALSTTSCTMWCRPEPSSVSPIYMPGRLRTASRPFSTLMLSAPYSLGLGMAGEDMGISLDRARKRIRNLEKVGAGAERREHVHVRTGHPRLRAKLQDFFEQRRAARDVEMRRDLIQQQDRAEAVARAG